MKEKAQEAEKVFQVFYKCKNCSGVFKESYEAGIEIRVEDDIFDSHVYIYI